MKSDAAAYGDAGSDTVRHVLQRTGVTPAQSCQPGPGRGGPAAARRAAPRGDLRPSRRARRRQEHHHRSLGDDGRDPGAPVSSTRALRRRGEADRAGVGRTGAPDRLGIGGDRPDRGHAHAGQGDQAGQLLLDGARAMSLLRSSRRCPRTACTGGDRRRSPASRGSGHRLAGHRDSRHHGATGIDLLHERDVPVVGVGKIGEIFTQRGVDVDDHTTDNTAGIAACTRPSGRDAERPAVRQPGRLRPAMRPPERR